MKMKKEILTGFIAIAPAPAGAADSASLREWNGINGGPA